MLNLLTYRVDKLNKMYIFASSLQKNVSTCFKKVTFAKN